MLCALALALALALSAVKPAAAYAQGRAAAAEEEPAGYGALIDEAIREYRARNFEEARALFRRANAMHPNARALRGIGMADFELRDYGDALAHLRAALSAGVKPLTAALREETEALAARAETFVAQLDLEVQPAAAELTLDGAPIALPGEGPLVLGVGDHVLEFRATGYATERRLFKVRGGEREAVHVELKHAEVARPAPPVALAPAPAGPPRDDERPPLYKNPWLWTGVGVALAAAGVGVGVWLAGRGDEPLVKGAPRGVGP